jgi:hypothetical protein
MRVVDELLKMRTWWMQCTRRKESDIRRIGCEGVSKRRRR